MTVRRRRANNRLELQGSLWITVGGENLGGRERIDLLRAVADQGSITRGAKGAGRQLQGGLGCDRRDEHAGRRAVWSSARPAAAAAARPG